jgi:hypothetical protein
MSAIAAAPAAISETVPDYAAIVAPPDRTDDTAKMSRIFVPGQ